jgi:hypothetical protein
MEAVAMRISTAAACCTLALLLAALPVHISAVGETTDVASIEPGRQLLVVNDNATTSATVVETVQSVCSQYKQGHALQ